MCHALQAELMSHMTWQCLLIIIIIINITIFIISVTLFVILNIIVTLVKPSRVEATDDLVQADSGEEKEIAFSADFSVTTSNQSNCFGQTCHFKTRPI